MTSERWRQIEGLYHAASEREPSQRGAFLDEACQGDQELRGEVESLLAQESSLGALLEGPVWEVAAISSAFLAAGTQLGPYQIFAAIGKGGMGAVYRARDTRLGRDVAVKVAQERFSARFEREARAIAALNHPHICQIHDVGPNYLVMEYVEGQPLKGPVPVNEALTIASQILDALDNAHRKGITHRDLKPDNILLGKAGVKVLDFGLAKMEQRSGASSDAIATEPLTDEGTVLGTLQYMSPEQIEGRGADARSDIFAFGLVLYELITGRRAFEGKTSTSLAASILKDQPRPLSELQPLSPPALERVVATCLEKDPDKRWQSAREVKHALEWISTEAQKPPAPAPARRKWLWAAVAASVAIAGTALAFWAPWRKPAPAQAVRFEVGPSEKMTFVTGGAMAVSPDGRWMVFPATGEDGLTRYYVRALDGVEVRALPGTETAIPAPASWSYDSRWVVFALLEGDKIRKMDIQGGPPQTLADFAGALNGAGWNSDGVIIAGSSDEGKPILRIPAAGGQATPVTSLAPGETGHRWPQFLPDGKHFLYERISSDTATAGVYIGSIDVQPKEQSMQRLLATDRQAYYTPSPGGAGHLIFMRQTTLMAQPFDRNKMVLNGEPVVIADRVDSYAQKNYGLFSVSNTGTLVYRGGSSPQTMLTWFDLQGNPSGTLGDPGDYAFPAISPDGSRVAVATGPQASRDIWILDVARGGASTRFTFDPARDDAPAWSPDGKNIAFSSIRGGQFDLYIKPADGSGEEKLLLHTDEYKFVQRWTRDGRFLLFDSTGPKTAQDIWALPYTPGAKPVALLKTQFTEQRERVSPDGRWLAYTSNESGTPEIYVRPFTPEAPAGRGAKWLVSKGGGFRSLWRPDGKELFYLNTNAVMAVDIDTSKGFLAGTPRRMFTAPAGAEATSWDLSPNGKRFLFLAPPGIGRTVPFTVVLNWAAGLKK
jgi:eukaryotic-like serine/threonine-protein kinase